jgi:ACT domain-containing protein
MGMNPQVAQQLANLSAEEANIAAHMKASAVQLQALEAHIVELSRQQKEAQDQATQSMLANLNLQMAQEKQKQAMLEMTLNNHKNLQNQIEANLSAAERRMETRVTVAADGKIALNGAGEFMAAGLTPSQLEAAIRPNATVRIEQSAGQMVTVLVPLGGSKGNFHVFGEMTTPNHRVVQSFEEDVTGQPAVAKAVPLRAGSYHMVVVVKNTATGAQSSSALDFTVD